jgi:hypothetical protein
MFSCRLDVLYGGLGISKMQLLIKKRYNKFSAVFFLQFFIIETLDPDWILNPESGSTTLAPSIINTHNSTI